MQSIDIPALAVKLDFGICNSAQGIRNSVPRIRSPQREIQNPRLSWIAVHDYTVVDVYLSFPTQVPGGLSNWRPYISFVSEYFSHPQNLATSCIAGIQSVSLIF